MTLERRVLIWMCVLVAVNQLGFGAMMPTLPLYAKSFGVPASAIGFAIAVFGLARFLVALPAGQLADRLGRSTTIAIGGMLSAAGNIWSAFALSFPEFVIARFVAGAGAGLVITTGLVVLADISRPENRGRMIAIYQGTFLFAVGIAPYPGGLIAERWGLAAPFVVCGTAALGVALVAWMFVDETRDLAKNARKPGEAPPGTFIDQLRLLAANPGFMLVSLIGMMKSIVRTGGMFAIVPLLGVDRLGLAISTIGFGMMLGSIAGVAAAYPSGWIADRYGRKVVIVPSTLVTGIAMIMFCVAGSAFWFIAACIAWSVAASVGGAAPGAYAADTAPPGMNAAAISGFRVLGDAGYVIGPLLLGALADLFGPVSSLATAAVMMVAMGLAFAAFAPETHQARKPAPI